MTNSTKLAQAIINLAEQDKGLVLSKLEELIEEHSSDAFRTVLTAEYIMAKEDDAYDRGFCDGEAHACNVLGKTDQYERGYKNGLRRHGETMPATRQDAKPGHDDVWIAGYDQCLKDHGLNPDGFGYFKVDEWQSNPEVSPEPIGIAVGKKRFALDDNGECVELKPGEPWPSAQKPGNVTFIGHNTSAIPQPLNLDDKLKVAAGKMTHHESVFIAEVRRHMLEKQWSDKRLGLELSGSKDGSPQSLRATLYLNKEPMIWHEPIDAECPGIRDVETAVAKNVAHILDYRLKQAWKDIDIDEDNPTGANNG
jgi:hypothetical protein